MKYNFVTDDLRADFPDWQFYFVSGEDGQRFLQGQLTNDLNSLTENSLQLHSRLDRNGRLLGFLYVGLKEEKLFLLIKKDQEECLIADLNKFIIMDDVELIKGDEAPLYINFGPKAEGDFSIKFGDALAYLSLDEKMHGEKLDSLEEVAFFAGAPRWGDNCQSGQLVNETRLMELSVSLSKGCFLGQEPVGKVDSRRGAAKYPVLIEYIEGSRESHQGNWYHWNDKEFSEASLKREDRVDKSTFSFKDSDLKVKIRQFPLFDISERNEEAQSLYIEAVQLFQKDKVGEEKAIPMLEKAIALDPGLADAYETLGVILGRHSRFEEAISLMDQLLECDPKSVMAHTNKSLYFMKLGKIEEAEAEKAKATIATFERQGEQSRALEEDEKKKAEELKAMLRREEMFLEVLEIDEEDSIALYGLAEIQFKKGMIKESLNKLDKLSLTNKKHPQSYLLRAKLYKEIGKVDEIGELLEAGLKIAASAGDNKLANEMQSLLDSISN